MLNEKLINKFKDSVVNKSKNYKSPLDFFMKLRGDQFNRLELMIMDSTLKNMPLENLYKTLLLTEEKYIEILQEIINKLSI